QAGCNAHPSPPPPRQAQGVPLSYPFVKRLLPRAGLLPRRRPRGRHRRRREPRPCFGELLHLDGSRHAWLALAPDSHPTLLAVVDDATKRLLYAQLVAGGESGAAIMTALRAVLETHRPPLALYTDPARSACRPPPSPRRPPPGGRLRQRVGSNPSWARPPKAGGRGGGARPTPQDRLVKALLCAGTRPLPAANHNLRDPFPPAFNAEFGRAPADPTVAFAPL